MDASPDELIPSEHSSLFPDEEQCPYFPGLVVHASSAVLRRARWVRGRHKGGRSAGVVARVDAGDVAVRWLMGHEERAPPAPITRRSNGLAADIWNWIAAGHSEEAIVAAVTSATEDAVGADIIDLIGELRDEGLIEPADGTELVEGAALSVRATGPYSSPQLEKYEDMQELITLDPIHEVNDEAGWPHRT